MKQLIYITLLVAVFIPLTAASQSVQNMSDTSGVARMTPKDSLARSLRAPDSLLGKLPGNMLKTSASQLQSFNPVNAVSGAYKTGISNISATVKGLNPLQGHTSAIRLSNVSVVISGDYINGPVPIDSSMYGTTDYSTVNGQVSGTLTMFNVPLSVGYQYQVLQGGIVEQSYTGTAINFDRAAFTQYLASRLQGKINPSDYLPAQFGSIDKMKEEAMGDLQKDVGNVQGQASGVNLNDWKTLNETDVNTLQRMVIPDSLRKPAAANQVLLGQMQAKINNHQPVDTAQYNKIMAQNTELKGKQQIFATILKYRDKWQSSGLTSMIKKLELDKATALANVLKNPALMGQLAKQNLSLNGVEKLFVDMKSLNLGRSVQDMSPMTLQQSVFQNGLGGQFLSGSNSAFGLTGGKMPSQTSGYEQMFSGNSFNSALAMSGLNLGKGSMDQNGSMMTMNMFKSNAASGLSNMLPFGSGGLQSFVLTLSKSLQVGDHGHLMIELSKSLSTGGGGQGGDGLSVSGLTSTSDLFKSLGVSMDFTNEYPKIHLTQELKFSSAASDYSNPGNAYMFSGMKQLSSSLQKTFLDGKLNILLRNSYTNFVTNPLVNERFLQYNNLLDARWKMKKGNYISLKYQPSWSDVMDSGMHTRVGVIQRFSADLNYNKKFGKHQLHTYTSLAYVRNTFADSLMTGPPISVNSIQLNSMVSWTIKAAQVYLNNTDVYTPQTTAYVYLNSTWTTEGGYMYPLGKKIQASSGLNYISVTDWYKQVGVKQSFTGSLSSKMYVSVFVDLGKNIAVYQLFPIPTIRGNLMLSYHL